MKFIGKLKLLFMLLFFVSCQTINPCEGASYAECDEFYNKAKPRYYINHPITDKRILTFYWTDYQEERAKYNRVRTKNFVLNKLNSAFKKLEKHTRLSNNDQ